MSKKNIVICCDGTGNEYGRNNTNVVETYALVVKDASQAVYYDPGVGTGGWEYNEESSVLRATSDQATGYGLQKNVEDAYRYLMSSYKEGDDVYLFGFSRGAFTVRSLAGMLYKCGLLYTEAVNLLEYASKIYNTKGNDGIAKRFRGTFTRKCPVHFIGVWDTVESLALNAGKRFHDAQLNPDVKYGFHALAIDEKRSQFQPSLWDERNIQPPQTIEQVWFAGFHSDVGGWYDERGLPNITLHWMLGKAQAYGLRVDAHKLKGYKCDPHDKTHQSYSGFWKALGKRARKIPEGANIHNSVFTRQTNVNNKYKPHNLPNHYNEVT